MALSPVVDWIVCWIVRRKRTVADPGNLQKEYVAGGGWSSADRRGERLVSAAGWIGLRRLRGPNASQSPFLPADSYNRRDADRHGRFRLVDPRLHAARTMDDASESNRDLPPCDGVPLPILRRHRCRTAICRGRPNRGPQPAIWSAVGCSCSLLSRSCCGGPYLVGRFIYQTDYNELKAGYDVATGTLDQLKPRLNDLELASRLVAKRVEPSVVSIFRPGRRRTRMAKAPA